MEKLRTFLGMTPAILLATFSIGSCKGLKVSSEKSQVAGACPAGSVDASGYCVKDGLIYLLHQIRRSDSQSGTSTNSINFGKQTFYKGDKVYAFGRFSFGKSGTGGLQTLGFRFGSMPIGSASSQYVGDQDAGVIVSRNTLVHEVAETGDATLSLTSLPTQPAVASGSDGGVLIFRASQLSETLASSAKSDGHGPYFIADMIDSDKLAATELKAAQSTSVINVSIENPKPNDMALVRAGFSWEPASGKTGECDGVALTWSLMAGGKELMTEGPYVISSARAMGSAALQAIQLPEDAAASKSFSLVAKVDTGGRADRSGCVLKVGEPSTLSVVVFRSTSALLSEINNARYLHQVGSVAAATGRFASNASGPPIETLLQFNWDHMRSDTLLTDVSITLGSEDRIKPTKTYLQLSRAPDSLSSHLGKIILKSPDSPRSVTIFDMAAEKDMNQQTRFYLTGMGFDDDAKPVTFDGATIFYMHFRRVGDRL